MMGIRLHSTAESTDDIVKRLIFCKSAVVDTGYFQNGLQISGALIWVCPNLILSKIEVQLNMIPVFFDQISIVI